MKWVQMFAITLIPLLITLYEWPKLRHKGIRDKAAFSVLTGAGWILAILLIVYPNMPGPSQMAEVLFKPLAKFIR